MLSVAENLKELREKRNMSQTDIAKQIGITQAGYSKFENGIKIPNANMMIVMAKAFGVEIQELYKER